MQFISVFSRLIRWFGCGAGTIFCSKESTTAKGVGDVESLGMRNCAAFTAFEDVVVGTTNNEIEEVRDGKHSTS